MKAKIVLASILGIVILALSACSAATAQPLNVDDSYNGKEIEMHTGDTFTVTLDSNPSTGFKWLTQIGDPSVVGTVDNKFVASTPAGQAPLPGTGGYEVWTFKALKAGKTTISMEYSRPWAGGEKAVQTFTLTANVK
jgi:inhibitor of cysteine peptidase